MLKMKHILHTFLLITVCKILCNAYFLINNLIYYRNTKTWKEMIFFVVNNFIFEFLKFVKMCYFLLFFSTFIFFFMPIADLTHILLSWLQVIKTGITKLTDFYFSFFLGGGVGVLSMHSRSCTWPPKMDINSYEAIFKDS